MALNKVLNEVLNRVLNRMPNKVFNDDLASNDACSRRILKNIFWRK